ncbi:hypothetical protein [Aquabacterium humicola]|uniref:hypothetical protein n=1 Tax=Aquabacterium humicola TaxID=3237377 RepID=UPI002543ABAB|nr:hypothetical protein [Rubrivivax pictus]
MQDLAFGRKASIILLGLNALLIASCLLGPTISVWVRTGTIWIMFLEGLFFAVILLPVLAYRLIRRKEHLKLAASRALQSFLDALSLAPS